MTLHRRLILAAAAFSLAATPLSAQAQTVMKLASATINDGQHEWQKLFVEALKTKPGGDKIKAEIYPASQLGAIPRMAEGVSLGTIEAFITPTAFVTNLDPRFQIFDVPGLFRSPEHQYAVIQDPKYRDHLETMFLDKGLRVIGAIYNSPTVILLKKPAPKLEDIKGQKVRTFASPLQVEPMKQLGAIAVPLALSEVVPQLQSGGLDRVQVLRRREICHRPAILLHPVGQPRERELVQGAAEGSAGRDPRRRPRSRAEGVSLGARQQQEVVRGLDRQQGRDPEAAGGRAGKHDEELRRARHQDRRRQPGGEEGIRHAEDAGRRQGAEVIFYSSWSGQARP
jgi:hypothetical protein